MRRTEQRSAILEELRKRKDHPTAYDMYNAVKNRIPKISLGTVYRNLEYLSGEGVIRKLASGSEQKRFDAVTVDHPHFRCVQCGKVEDLPPDGLPDLLPASYNGVEGRQIFEVNVEFVGLCTDCAKTGKKKDDPV